MDRSIGRELFASLDNDDNDSVFTASDAWVSKFMKRNDLSLRRRTNLTVLTDDVLVGRAVSYMRYLRSHMPTYNPEYTVLMDETAVFFEDPRNTTVDTTGARHVVVRLTGSASIRVTVVLVVTASGCKLSPLVVWKHKNGSRAISTIDSVWVAYQPKAWVDSELLMRWLDAAFPPVVVADGKALVWDSMRAHISKAVKAKMRVAWHRAIRRARRTYSLRSSR